MLTTEQEAAPSVRAEAARASEQRQRGSGTGTECMTSRRSNCETRRWYKSCPRWENWNQGILLPVIDIMVYKLPP